MASGDSCPCHFPHQNLPSIDYVEDELAKDPNPANSFYSDSTSPALSCNPTLGPVLVLALIPALVPAPAPALPSSNKLFKQFMKTYLKSNQGLKQSPVERKQSLKAKLPEVYYNKLHIDCYHFCQQCKKHFEIARATGANQTPFAAFFFCGNINLH